MTPAERAQLHALVNHAWLDRGDPERMREHAELIVEWNCLRALNDPEVARETARGIIRSELERQSRLPSTDEVARLCQPLPCERRLRVVA